MTLSLPAFAARLRRAAQVSLRAAGVGGAVLCAALMTTQAAAQSGAPLVWVTQANGSTPQGVSSLIMVTPTTSQASVANQLKARPAGQRGLLLVGFADDLNSAEILRRPAAASTTPVPSPWIDKGAANAKSRVSSLMNRLKRLNASVDFVVVRSAASSRTDRYESYGAPGWRTIQADKRFPAVKSALGITNLPVDMANSAALRQAWNDYFDAKVDTDFSKAVADSVTRYFPSAKVVAENRYSLPSTGQALSRRVGGNFGAYDQPAFYMDNAGMYGFDALAAAVSDFVAADEVSARRVLPSIAVQNGTGGNAALVDSGYWGEQIYHMLLSGAPAVMINRGVLAPADISQLGAIVSDFRAHVGSGGFSIYDSGATIDSDAAVASSVRVGNSIIWRLSAAPSQQTLKLTFSDNTEVDVPVDPQTGGAWYSHPTTQYVAMIQGGSASGSGGSGGSQPTHAVLFDVAPANGFVQPVERAQHYLIVYQNAGDPNSHATGLVNATSVIAEIQHQLNMGVQAEYGVLDFEDPFDNILMTGPAHPQYAATMQSLIDCIRAVKAAFPQMKWTYYGFPRVAYNPNARDWAWWTEQQREAYYPLYSANYDSIMTEMDWFMPSVYDKYERAANLPNSYSPPMEAERAFRRANVMVIRRYFETRNLPVPPIMPVISPWYQLDGSAYYLKPIPFEELTQEQLQPLFEVGVDGVCIWSAMDYFFRMATMVNFPAGYEVMQAMVRSRFATDYFGGMNVGMIDWYAHPTSETLGNALNTIMEDALEACGAGSTTGP